MAKKCSNCEKTVFWAEEVSSLGKAWHKLCLKCDRCNKLLTAGGHAEHDRRPYCHMPCYAALFGPSGVNIGGALASSYTPMNTSNPAAVDIGIAPMKAEKRVPKAPAKSGSVRTLSFIEANLCPRCNKNVFFAEKVTSLGKDWHRPCLSCERCRKTLNAGSHAEHDGKPFCNIPCYAALFGPRGVNIGGAGSYIYDSPGNNNPAAVDYSAPKVADKTACVPEEPERDEGAGSQMDDTPVTNPAAVNSAPKSEEKRAYVPKGPEKAGSSTTFTVFGETNLCPRCNKKVYFAEKVTSLGKDWHRPCLHCEKCRKTLAPGSHAAHDGQPYCHKPCYAHMFGPQVVSTWRGQIYL